MLKHGHIEGGGCARGHKGGESELRTSQRADLGPQGKRGREEVGRGVGKKSGVGKKGGTATTVLTGKENRKNMGDNMAQGENVVGRGTRRRVGAT